MRFGAATLTITLVAAPALAHDTWLLPDRFEGKRGEVLPAHATSAMDFPRPESPIAANRIARSGLRLAGGTRGLQVGRASRQILPLRASLDGEGVATLWLVTRPRTLDLEPKEVEHYLKEVGAWETVGARWQREGRKPWRETYAKVATAFVRVGTTGDRSWAEPLGLPFEIVPESDPTAAAAGGSIAFRVLREGKPAAGQAVGAQPGGGHVVMASTDAEGRVTFPLDKAGPWLVKATAIEAGRDGEWNSVFTTVTFAVRP